MDRITRWTVAALLLLPSAALAQAGSECPEPDLHERVVFNHYEGALVGPSPAVLELKDGEVFEIRFCKTLPNSFDYEISPIATDKERETSFKSPTTRAVVDLDDLTTTGLSWKHREEFSLYKVSVTVRGGEENPEVEDPSRVQAAMKTLLRSEAGREQEFVQPFGLGDEEQLFDLSSRQLREGLKAQNRDVPEELEPVYLYSYTFPVWVKTVRWKLTYSGGLAFSDLRDRKFFVQTDDQGTDATDDDVQRVLRERDAEGDSRPDLVLFANLVTPDAGWWAGRSAHEATKKHRETEDPESGGQGTKCCRWRRALGGRLGLAFGLGLNGDGKTRYFFGPSWTIGRKRHFVAIAGWTGGEVDRLPGKQTLGAPPVDANVLNELNSSFEHGFFAGLTFSFNSRQEPDELNAILNGKAGPTDTEKAAKPGAGKQQLAEPQTEDDDEEAEPEGDETGAEGKEGDG